MATKQTIANIDHERRVREVAYTLKRLHDVVAIGEREGWVDLVRHATEEIAVLEAEKDAWP